MTSIGLRVLILPRSYTTSGRFKAQYATGSRRSGSVNRRVAALSAENVGLETARTVVSIPSAARLHRCSVGSRSSLSWRGKTMRDIAKQGGGWGDECSCEEDE